MTEDRSSSISGNQHETVPPSAAGSNNNDDGGGNHYYSNKNSRAGPGQPRTHFLYADYTPLEDDRNLVEMLKAFVSLAAQMIQRHETDVKCLSLLDDSELLRKEVASAIRNARVTAAGALDRFYERNSGVFASVAGLESASGNAFVTGAKTSLGKMLADVELNSSQQQEKHKENIRSIINASRVATINAIQAWLSDENRDFPQPVLESLSAELAVNIDPASSNDSYKVIRTASAAAVTPYKKEGEMQQQKKKASDKTTTLSSSSRFMYVSRFNTAGVEFWNYRKKVIDFGIEELMLPTGMRLPMSEKVKSTFRLSSRKDEPAKEPHFIKADDFYVSSVVLHDRKTLEVLLASDVAAAIAGPAGEEGRGELFTLVFDASGLTDDSATLAAVHPVVRYTDNKEQAIMAETNLLQIKEIEQATNLRKLATLGTAVLTKLQILQDPGLLASRGKLNLLTVEEKEAISASGRSVGSDAAAALVFVEFSLIFNLVEALARSFGPVVERLKEKTPVQEELILRQELDGGQRREFAVRLDDLRSQLGETPFGKSVFRTVFGA